MNGYTEQWTLALGPLLRSLSCKHPLNQTTLSDLEERKVRRMLPFSHWQNLYLLVGTASATLIGLLFVAISLGSSILAPQAKAYLRTFVTPIFYVYAQIVRLLPGTDAWRQRVPLEWSASCALIANSRGASGG